MSESNNVKCKDCGFLAVRNADTYEFLEAPDDYRNTGKLPIQLGKHAWDVPLCFVRAFNLKAEYEINKANSTDNNAQAIAKVNCLEKPRDCAVHGKFIGWTQGFSPREHLQMKMLEDQRAWQRRCDEEDRKWRELQAKEADARYEAQVAAAEAHHRDNLREVAGAAGAAKEQHSETIAETRKIHWREMLILGIVATSVLAVAQITSAIIPLWFREPPQPIIIQQQPPVVEPAMREIIPDKRPLKSLPNS